MIYFNQFIAKCRTCVLLYSKSSIGRTLSDDINIETDNFDNGVYWITPSTLGNPSGSYGRLVKMDNYKMFASAIATSGIYYTRELWVSIYVNSTWTPFNGFSDDATLPLPLMNNMRKIHTGWIRVAKYQAESTTVAQGSKGYGALLTIKSFYSNRYPVYYLISFHAGHQTSGFTIIDSYKGNGILQKIRHTVDANTNTAYIELNISDAASENNSITVTILDNINGYGDQKWESVNAESTDESVSGVTVISSLSLQ